MRDELREKIIDIIYKWRNEVMTKHSVSELTDKILSLIPEQKEIMGEHEILDVLFKHSQPFSAHHESMGIIFDNQFKDIAKALSGKIEKQPSEPKPVEEMRKLNGELPLPKEDKIDSIDALKLIGEEVSNFGERIQEIIRNLNQRNSK